MAEAPTSGDSEMQLLTLILRNQGGPEVPESNETEHLLWLKIAKNQVGQINGMSPYTTP